MPYKNLKLKDVDIMKFSVIVPIYNISSYIDQCVESIINQTYKNIEIILVNDGSTDNSLDKVKSWEKKDCRVIAIDKPNGGLSDARNAGLKIASGDYICFVDGDDWIDETSIMICKNFIENNGLVDLLCFDYWCYYSPIFLKHISYGHVNGVFKGIEFFNNSRFKLTAWSKIYRKDYLDKIGLLFLKGRLHEDISYTIPLCNLAENIGYIDKPLYYYRQNRKDSIMSKVTYRNVLDFSHAICFNYYFFKERNMINPIITSWVMKCFYKACFTGQTDFKTLKRAFVENNVIRIAEELGDGKWFWTKLFFYHSYMKARTYLGVVKRLVKNKLQV